MGSHGHLTCTHRKRPPSRTALETIARIRQVLEQGCTPEQLAQARAELQAPCAPRQPQLPLRVKP